MKSKKNDIIILGADHNGVELKNVVKRHLSKKGYRCIDIGPFDSSKKVDYVDYAATLAKILENQEANWGVLMCGTGVGMSMVANKFSDVRAALVHNLETAPKSREHLRRFTLWPIDAIHPMGGAEFQCRDQLSKRPDNLRGKQVVLWLLQEENLRPLPEYRTVDVFPAK